jgi:hypothetical protein
VQLPVPTELQGDQSGAVQQRGGHRLQVIVTATQAKHRGLSASGGSHTDAIGGILSLNSWLESSPPNCDHPIRAADRTKVTSALHERVQPIS